MTARDRIPVVNLEFHTVNAEPKQALLDIYQAALDRVHGRNAVRNALADGPLPERPFVVALGKAAQAMLDGAMEALGNGLAGGLAVSKPGHLDQARLRQLGITALEGAHPLPDASSLAAGEQLVRTLEQLDPEQPILFLISGGASSLVELPVTDIGLPELARVTQWLLGSGLGIGEINLVRKSLSRIKAGGLLAYVGARPARALLISDVPGNDPAAIGSGLLVPTPDLAERVLALDLPDWLRAMVESGLAERPNNVSERPPELQIVARLEDACRAAEDRARALGYPVLRHPEFRGGEAEEEGAQMARQLLAGPAGVQIWGGETVVRLPDQPGRGGRNQQLALAAAVELAGRPDAFFLSAGSDGTDGPTADAGALVDGGSVDRGVAEALDAADSLRRADAGTFLAAAGDLVNTGPTGTNVMDLMIGLKTAEVGT